ncbi:Phosphoenolpyruvate/pyruvate domain-containing protein [Pholiota conissans]|uniref:Phosphoenolpyruvate/pyruvate domain-containing protein n=1 Tax=Pholiota conissans TaxID=109636 RepID=A0A9P5Z701_9AGAR|nr:Phosphoenolpyruvate/pyruvate domain-containing protein [Pholiota conissans]
MDRISRFLPGFGAAAGTDTTEPDTNNPGVFCDELLGLQRVMADAQNPKRPVIGSWMMFPGASLARMIAQMGYDFIVVDCEHGNIDDAAMHASVGAIAAEGCSPLVRVPAPEYAYVKRALDTGAHGILAPFMNTAEEARKLVSYAKFPAQAKSIETSALASAPLSGVRGVGSPFAPAVFRQTFPEYVRTANRNTFVAVQIETLPGLENCEEIAKVDGIDMLFIGPNDLASSMGYPSHLHESIPEVQEAIKRILAAAHNAGKYAGMFCTEAAHVRARFEQGFDLMNLAGDVVALTQWNATELGKLSDINKGKGKENVVFGQTYY